MSRTSRPILGGDKSPLILGLAGEAGTGKDTMADYLCREHGFVKIAFADRFKVFVQEVFDFSDAQLYGVLKEVPDKRYPRGDGTFLSPREAIQRIGDEWGRRCYPNTWVDLTIRNTKKLLQGTHTYTAKGGLKKRWFRWRPAGVVISDVRYLNEIYGVRGAGGSVIRLLRPMRTRFVSPTLAYHASETTLQTVPVELFADVFHVPDGLRSYYREIDTFLLRLQRQAKAA